ncbi:g-type lectin s-receptor-like serine/threonine-protein kinase lecrk3 [Fagus crenata]
MATIFLFLLLLSTIFTVEAQQRQSIVKPGSSLTPTTKPTWLSSSGLYAFGFYKQGNGYAVGIFLAGIPQKTVIWTANRDNPPVPADVTLNFTSDGRLVLQSTQFTVPSLEITADGATSASMLDTGNFVVYNSDNKSIWESFQHPTDTLLPTQKLSASANDDAVLDSSMALLLYPRGTPYRIEYGYWSKNVPGPLLGASLNLGVDGRLYLANGNNTNIISPAVNSTTGRVLYRLRMDSDGFLRLYSYNMAQLGRDWSITWSVKNDNIDRCEPKGLCGVNAFCVIYDEDYNCSCLPGFTYIDNSIRTYGCERISAIEGCREESIAYTMEAESNTIWENNTYSFPLFSSTEEECKNACLEDCNCEAAFFKDSACRKQRLPLRFGRRKPEDTNIALIKVRTSTPTTDGIVPKETKKEVRLDILIISVSLVAFAIIVFALSGIVIYKSCVFGYRNTSNNGNIVLSDDDFAPRSFTYAELEKMTDNFKEELGRGSFGIIICCRKSVDCNLPEEEAILEEWTYSCFESGEIGKLVNDEEIDKRQFERMVKVALWCILDEPSLRPSMKKILLMLEGTEDIPIPPSPNSILNMI